MDQIIPDRRKPRQGTAMPGRLRFNVTTRAAVAVTDLSVHGCRIATATGLAVDSPVFVRLDQLGALRAIVRWQRDGAAGLEFDQPLYPPVYDHLLAEWPARGAATSEDSDSPPLPHG